MLTGPPGNDDDAGFARWLAAQAGQALLDVRTELGYADPGALKAAGDKVSHEVLRTELARWRPADAVLSEEDEGSRLAWTAELGRAAVRRLTADRVWIVDPLDGTREFAEEGRADWAVHVALWDRRSAGTGHRSAGTGHGLVVGAVALPARGRVLGADVPPPYPSTGELAEPGGMIRLAASRSRPPVFLTDFAAEVGARLVPMGSAGAKITAVIDGEVDAYVHAGGQYEWDSAAPVAVATATGLHASRIDGSALQYNEADPRLPDLLVCRTELAPRLLAALRRHTG